MADGTLAPGARLPATRVLAEDLSVARGTVVEAYRRLAEEGLVVTNRGGGTVVAATLTSPTVGDGAPGEASGRPLLNISAGAPDLSAFPRAAWLRAERQVLATATERELGYTDPQGPRNCVARWPTGSPAAVASPSSRSGSSSPPASPVHSACCAKVLRARGVDRCAVEDPGAMGNRRILEHWLDELHPVPVDEDGLDVAALARTGARAALVTPAHQFPTGVVLSPARRRGLIRWAEEHDGLVIEDDYDAEYRYDRAPVRAMHASAPERIVHVSSLSKVLAPALRIGWMIAPGTLHEALVHSRWATDLGSPALPQLTLAALIDAGVLERHLRTLRSRHRARRDAAVAAIGRHLPGCRIEGVAAGLHLVVRLPDHIDDAGLAARAAHEGLAVQSLSAHRFTPGPPGLVIGYGPHSAPLLERAIRTLGVLAGIRRD